MGNFFKDRIKRLNKKDIILLVISVFLILVIVNFLSSKHFIRVDLTEKKQYTLSESSKKILNNLDDIVNIQCFFSKNLPPAILKIKNEVDDMLDEYRQFAGSKIKIEYIDPKESQAKQYAVQTLGIPLVRANVIEKDEQILAEIYFGIAVVHEGRREIIPAIRNTVNLEYDLTSAIVQVIRENKPQIAWISDHKDDPYSEIKRYLDPRYSIRNIAPENFELDVVKDSLLISTLQGDLDDNALFKIDQYIMNGGRVFFLVDRVELGQNMQVTELSQKNLLDWLENNNILVESNFVLDLVNAHAAFSGGYVTYHVPYPYWIKVVKDGFNPDNPIVSDLDLLVLPWTSSVRTGSSETEGVDYSILVHSSQMNSEVSLDSSLMPDGIDQLITGEKTDPVSLALWAGGKLASVFAKGKKPSPVSGVNVKEVSENGQVVVIGNTRFISNNFLKQFSANSVFFENAVDFLAMGNELIGIRSKGVIDRPIKQISSGYRGFVKYLNILLAPIILLCIGAVILIKRRE